MDESFPRKRKRVVTACSECYRRKQKCNRELPCNNCTLREVTEKCSYGGIPSVKQDEDHEIDVASSASLPAYSSTRYLDNESEVLQPNTGGHILPEQLGYSSTRGKKTLEGLQKYFHDHGNAVTDKPKDLNQKVLVQKLLKDRYLNTISQLPVQYVIKELVEVFFVEANWYFSVLHHHYFDQMFSSWTRALKIINKQGSFEAVSREDLYFPALLFQVLAVALQFMPPGITSAEVLDIQDASSCNNLSQNFSSKGMEVMRVLGRHNPNLTTVQHDIMRALWLKNGSKGTESWYSLGTAIRQAQDLGLHIQAEVRQNSQDSISSTLERLWYDEYKRRLWVTLFVWDSHMALVLDRPRTINRDDCTIRTPLNVEIPDDPSKRIPAEDDSNRPQPYSPYLFSYAIAHEIHTMLSLRPGKRHLTQQEISNLQDRVMKLMYELPATARPGKPDKSWDVQYPHLPKQREQILSIASSFLLSVYRDHAETYPEYYQAAINEALNTLESQDRLFSIMKPHQYKIYGLSCYSIDACIYLSSILFEDRLDDDSLLRRICNTLSKSIKRLSSMGEMSPMAKSGAQILSQCHERVSATLKSLTPTTPDLSSDGSSTVRSISWDHIENLDNGDYHQLLELGDRFQPSMFEAPPSMEEGDNPSWLTDPNMFGDLDGYGGSDWLGQLTLFSAEFPLNM